MIALGHPVNIPKKKIYIVNGLARAGKDTFASLLGKFLIVKKISSVDDVKKIAKSCGWDGGKTEKDRKFLSDLKLLLTNYNDFPFKSIEGQVHVFNNFLCSDVLLIDIREPREIERAKQEFGAETIFIVNDRVPQITSNMADANVKNYKYDYYIFNNGTLEEFEQHVKEFAEEVVKKEE